MNVTIETPNGPQKFSEVSKVQTDPTGLFVYYGPDGADYQGFGNTDWTGLTVTA